MHWGGPKIQAFDEKIGSKVIKLGHTSEGTNLVVSQSRPWQSPGENR
jgi:hypothetical protein